MNNMTPEKFDRVMITLINKMGIDIDIRTGINGGPRFIYGVLFLGKGGRRDGSSLGYPFFYNKVNGDLVDKNDPNLIAKYDLFKVLPPKMVTDYFSNKVKEHLLKEIKEGIY